MALAVGHMRPSNVPLFGIVGGIASGKSMIADHLERLGAAVVRADPLAHLVLKQDDVKRRARERWGDSIFAEDGQIDRPELSKIVFAPPPDGPREREFLERLTHPRIGELAREQVARLSEQPEVRAIVLDVPLLFESGWNKFCDKTLFVDAPRPKREARAVARGWTAEEFARREATQESLEKKRRLADVVIDNSGTFESAQGQVEKIWYSLIGSSPSK